MSRANRWKSNSHYPESPKPRRMPAMKRLPPVIYARFAEVLPNGRGRIHDGKKWIDVPGRTVVEITRRAMLDEILAMRRDE